MSSVSGMAASIRAATESETFDLAGQNPTTITNTVNSAFSTPLPLKDMIRITFITGAGKLGRQKYDEGAAKAVTSTLRDLGFEDDRGASCVVECAGSFKLQHDTGKNLKTVVVFPNIVGPSNDSAGLEDGVAGMSMANETLLPEGCPEQMIAMSSKTVFERMISSKCASWAQKKGCLAAIDYIKVMLGDLDSKLLSGTPLSDAEQSFYDSVSMGSLEEKESFVKKGMQAQVEAGNISSGEKELLLKQNADRLETLAKEIEEAQSKPKKLEKLKNMKSKAEQRRTLLEEITPKASARLRHEPEITKLRVEMAPYVKLENDAKGRLLSIKETQTLAKKTEIEEQIAELEEASRGWFEENEAFEARVEASRKIFSARQKTKKKPSSKAGGGYKPAPAATKFVVPGASKKGWGKSAAKKKAAPKGGNLFAAMMDSDSD